VILAHDPPLSAESEYRALLAIEEANRRAVSWVLADLSTRFEELAGHRQEVQKRLREYRAGLVDALPPAERKRYRDLAKGFGRSGIDEELATRLADCYFLTAGLRIADIAGEYGAPLDRVTALYYRLGQESYIHPLVRRFDEHVFVGRWESLALRIARNSLLDSLWALVARLVERHGPIEGADWVESTIAQVESRPVFRELRQDIRRLGREEISIAAMQVLSVRLARIVS